MLFDSGLVLAGSYSLSELLFVLRAKELAQATLAHAVAETVAKTSRSTSAPPPTASAAVEASATVDRLQPEETIPAPSPHKWKRSVASADHRPLPRPNLSATPIN